MENPFMLGTFFGMIFIIPVIILVYYFTKKKGHKWVDNATMIFGIAVALIIGVLLLLASKKII